MRTGVTPTPIKVAAAGITTADDNAEAVVVMVIEEVVTVMAVGARGACAAGYRCKRRGCHDRHRFQGHFKFSSHQFGSEPSTRALAPPPVHGGASDDWKIDIQVECRLFRSEQLAFVSGCWTRLE
jgi:hypothetical protein